MGGKIIVYLDNFINILDNYLTIIIDLHDREEIKHESKVKGNIIN